MIGLFSKEKREAKLEEAIRKEMAAGLFHRALPFFLERERYEEAADIESRRGRIEEAAKLYERGRAWKKAAEMYIALGQLEAAAAALTKGDLAADAAELMQQHNRHAEAARLYLDVGDKMSAARAYEQAGDLERAQDLYESSGADQEAQETAARRAEAAGRWAEVAEIREAMGDIDAAARAWDKADEPGKAALLRARSGDYEKAVEVLLANNEFLPAARLLAEHGKLREAAEAAFKAGELDHAVGYLEQVGDFVTMAKVFLAYGRRDEAKQALEKVPEEGDDFEMAHGKLAALYNEDLNTKAAYATLQRLVERRLNNNGPFDDEVRRWIVEMVQLLIGHGKNTLALKCFETLDKTGLMTEQLQQQRHELGVAIHGPGYVSPGGGGAKATQASAPTASGGDLRQLSGQLGMPQSSRYDFTRKIGQGGNGAIYLATDTVLGRDVVIKMIINSQLPSDLAKKWFFREAQVAAKLNHSNIVTVYDLAEIDGQPYIAMEYVEGEDLSVFLADKVPLHPLDVLPIFKQFSDALQYAHDAGVVHRDIKLENVMITSDGSVKLMDFGLAKAIQGGSTTMVIAGTPAYMSPEQILGQNIDHRTDIYAAGVMLFFMLTGEFPYAEGNILDAHRGQPIPDPRDYVQGLGAGYEQLMFHSMAKKKEMRYDRIADLFRDFERLAKR